MPIKWNKHWAIIAVVISIVIVLLGIIFPLTNFYGSLFSPQPDITVLDGYANVTYSGNFQNNTSNNDYFFPNEIATANVSESSGNNSTFSIEIGRGSIFYDSGSGDLTMGYMLSVSGHFATTLHPRSLTLMYNASGPKNQTLVNLATWAPPFSSWGPNSSFKPVSNNLSDVNLGNLVHSGFGSVSVTTLLLNESSSSLVYNFSLSVFMQITLQLYHNSTHSFLINAQLNGLQKPVTSCIQISLKEVNI